jgi:hypothetical protein
VTYQADANQGPIVEALRRAGAVVYLIEGANGRKGVPDLLVAANKQTWLLEVKKPLGPKGGGRHEKGQYLSAEQEEFTRAWVLQGGPCAVVRNPEEALFLVYGRRQ